MKLATRSFPETPLDLHLKESPFLDFLCGKVSTSSTKLEIYTAIIGDRIFEEWFAASFTEMILCNSGASLQKQLDLIRSDVETAIDCNATFMKGILPSPERVCRVIECHLDRLGPEFRSKSDIDSSLVWMYHLEQNLRLWVCPWFDIRLNKSYKKTESGNQVSVQLLNPKNGRRIAGKLVAMSTLDCIRLGHARMLQRLYDEERRKILESRSLLTSQHGEHPDLKAALFRYRKLVETGDWSTVPLIVGWSLRSFQLQSLVAVYKSILRVMCASSAKSRDWEHDFEALSADLKKADLEQKQAMSEHHPALKRVFDRLGEQGVGHMYDPDPQIEEFSKIRNSRKSEPVLPMFSPEAMWSELGGPDIQFITKPFPPDVPRDQIGPEFLAATYRNDPALIHAVRNGRKDEVRQLLEGGAETEVINDPGANPLQVAVYQGKRDIVKLLLDYNADVHAEIVPGYTALHLAVSREDADIAKLLLENGAKIEKETVHEAVMKWNETMLHLLLDHGAHVSTYKYGEEWTVLHRAATEGSVIMARRFIDNGAQIDARDSSGATALYHAAENGRETVVRLLLGAGANVEAEDNKHLTALHIAANKKHAAVVQALLDHRANLEASFEGLTPLFMAAMNTDEPTMRLLLVKGANPNVACVHGGGTPLHGLASSGTPSMLELLLQHGARVDPQATEPQGQTPLHIAAIYGAIPAAKVLLQWGANIDARYHDGQTPLHVASVSGRLEMVAFLLAQGADIVAQTNWSDIAFTAAASQGHGAIAELLFDKGNDVMTATQKTSGLIMATRGGHVSLVASLLDREIPVNAVHESGLTALLLAASYGYEQVVTLLIARGADVDARGNAFDTSPVQIAELNGHAQVVQLLQQALSQRAGAIRCDEPRAPSGDDSANDRETRLAHGNEPGTAHGNGREAVESSTQLPTRGRDEAAGSKTQPPRK